MSFAIFKTELNEPRSIRKILSKLRNMSKQKNDTAKGVVVVVVVVDVVVVVVMLLLLLSRGAVQK